MRCEDSVGFHVKEISNLMDRAMFVRSMEQGADKITASHGWMISYLYHNREKEIYQKTMEREFHMPKSTVTSILQAMEKSGFITREGVAHDARLKKILLTEAGRRFYRSTKEFMEEIDQAMCGEITAEELAVFMKVVWQMEENLKADLKSARQEDRSFLKEDGKKSKEETTC